MNLGNILNRIIERKAESLKMSYGSTYDSFFANLNSIPEMNQLKIKNILLVTDQRPFSLIAIAYAIRLTKSLGDETQLFSMTEGKHNEDIKSECEYHNIKLMPIAQLDHIDIEKVQEFVSTNDIGLVIVPYAHHLYQSIIEQVSVTTMVTTLRNIK